MSKNMRLEVLMSVMYQEDFDIAYKAGIKTDLLIINQCDKDEYQETFVDGHLWRMISTTERGLSKSRNMAIKNSQGDICLFCDDDETMAEGYSEIITNAFKKLCDATGIVFNLNRINYTMKKTYYKITTMRLAPKYRAYGSPMLAVKMNDIKRCNLFFNEKFGSGSLWGGGEDSLFEYELRKKGMKLYEYPAEIATIDYSNESKWFFGYTEQYFYNLGGYYGFLYKSNYILRLLWEIYSCYKLRKEKKISLLKKMYWMYQGGRGIDKNVTYTEFLDKQNRK